MKIKIISGLLGLVSLVTTSLATANTVSFVEGPNFTTGGANPITLTLQATFDTDPVDAGDIIIHWDDALFDYVSISAVDPLIFDEFHDFGPSLAGDTSITGDQLAAGQEGIGMSLFFEGGAGQASGGPFNLITITLNTTLPSGVFTDVIGIDDVVFGGWAAGGSPITGTTIYEPVTVSVGAVPVPAAAWLFASGLLGMVGIARRQSTKAA